MNWHLLFNVITNYLLDLVNQILFLETFGAALRFRQLQFVLWNAWKHNVLLVGFQKKNQNRINIRQTLSMKPYLCVFLMEK